MSVIVIVPVRGPAAVGVKITCSLQFVACVSVLGQLFVSEKSPWIAMLLIPISTDALVLAISTGTAGVEIAMGWGSGRRSTVVGQLKEVPEDRLILRAKFCLCWQTPH